MSVIHRILSAKLNSLLVRDRTYLANLQTLAGRSVKIDFVDLHLKINFIFYHCHVEVLSDYAEPDLCLWGTSAALGQFLLRASSRQQLLQSQQVDFSGDLLLLEQLAFFWQNFDFDAPLWVKKATEIGLKNVWSRIKQISKNRVQYYQEERPYMVSPVLYQYFVDELLSLQEGLDRCQARLDYLSDKV